MTDPTCRPAVSDSFIPCDILTDPRRIAGAYFNDEYGSQYEVGKRDCTAIVAYGEPGEYCMIPWLAIYHGEVLFSRLPARMVQIIYGGSP